jgi:nitrogenase molybdenum-iron protein alpha/beta subunit
VTRMHVNEAVSDALFASPLQPSDTLTAETVAQAIGSTVRRFGPAGCASRMADEFGHHPDEAADRMRWIRQLTSAMCGCLYFPTAVPATAVSTAAGLLPVREAA